MFMTKLELPMERGVRAISFRGLGELGLEGRRWRETFDVEDLAETTQ